MIRLWGGNSGAEVECVLDMAMSFRTILERARGAPRLRLTAFGPRHMHTNLTLTTIIRRLLIAIGMQGEEKSVHSND